MGQTHTIHDQKTDDKPSVSKPEFRHEPTQCLIDRFQSKTLEIVVGSFCKNMSSLDICIGKQLATKWNFDVDPIEGRAKQNNGILIARIEVVEKSNTFMDLAQFLVSSKADAEKVALHMMILHALLIENDGAVNFNFLRDPCARDGDNVKWLEPRIIDPLGAQLQNWFDDAVEKGILDVKGTASCNGKPVFRPKIYYPSDSVITMLECGGIMIQTVQLAGKDTFLKYNKFR